LFQQERSIAAQMAQQERQLAASLYGQRLAQFDRADSDAFAAEMGIERDFRQADLQQEQLMQRFDLGQMEADRQAQRAAEMNEWQYTTAQRRDLEKINNDIHWVNQRDDWRPEQKDYAIRQLEAKRAGIKPMPMPGEGMKFPEGQDIGAVWKDDKSGAVLTRDD